MQPLPLYTCHILYSVSTQKNPILIGSHSPSPHCSSPWQSVIYFLSLDLPIWTFHINEIMQCVTFCVWLLSLTMFLRFIFVVASISTSPNFYDWIIFRCMDVPHFIYPLISRWTFGLLAFFFFGYNAYCCYEHSCTSVCVNRCVISLRYISRGGCWVCGLCLRFWGAANLSF